jgi:uncharacterized membrane protein
MQDMIAVGFPGKHRAAEVLGQLQTLDAREKIDLTDAVAAYRTDDGRLRIDRNIEPTTKQGAALGGLIGAMLGGILAAPFTAGVSAAAAATAVGVSVLGVGSLGAAMGAEDAGDWKAKYGVPEEFVRQVGGMIQPGTSAVFALVSSDVDPVTIAKYFSGAGGTVLRTRLSTAKAERVQQTIAAR